MESVRELILEAAKEVGIDLSEVNGVPVEVKLRGKPLINFVMDDDQKVVKIILCYPADDENNEEV